MFHFEKIYYGWSLERFIRHVLYWLAWLLFYAMVNSSYSKISFIAWINTELLIMWVKLPYTYFVIYYLVPNYLVKKRYITFFFLVVSFAILGGLMIWFLHLKMIAPYILYYKPLSFWHLKNSYKMLDLIYIASLPTILKLLQSHIQQEKLTLQLAEQKVSAELKLLKNQLQPHFLFNTLNNLYGMVLTQHSQAADVVIRLSEMMSYMLYECEGNSVSLGKEMTNLENYIALEKIRYGTRLDISFEIDGIIQNETIVPLLFIPFVENAFKHGVAKSEASSWIRINLWLENQQLYFMIENSLPPKLIEPAEILPTRSGIGLSNVKKRLNLLYPNRHKLEITQGDTYLVQLNLMLSNEMSYSG